MLITAIITGLLALIFGILWIANVRPDQFGDRNFVFPVLSGVFGTIWLIAFLLSINLSPGIQHYTGYIYATSNQFGYTTAHIRYSQNAGMDVQNPICVATDSEAGQKLVALAGTNTKVNITVPSYFYFAENPFACGTTKTTVTVIPSNPAAL